MCPTPVSSTEGPSDAQLVSVLDHHYGDGAVYLPENTPWSLYTFAKNLGYISDEGYLTKKGRELLSKFEKFRS